MSEKETVVESPAEPTPYKEEVASKLIKAMKDSSSIQSSLQELSHMEYWYRAPGAVVAVGNIARTHTDVAVRIDALQLLGRVPLTMAEATTTIRSVARDSQEPTVREAANALLSERAAARASSTLR